MQKSRIFKYVNMPKTIVPLDSACFSCLCALYYTALHHFCKVFMGIVPIVSRRFGRRY